MANEVRDLLSQRLRRLRQEANLTQAELGARAGGIKTGEISRFERAHRTPSVETLARLAEGLGVPLWELLRFEGAQTDHHPGIDQVAAMLRGCPDHTVDQAVAVVRALTRVEES
ncbi:MAG: helix-turn-helix transcriptional regulator [Alphaproteobacteria bacterium]|nr:helix-turn-helix transcriptional regulator [Alphaproteobacteria bacterium]